MSFLEHKLSFQEIIDSALLDLWYADCYGQVAEDWSQHQKEQFILQAEVKLRLIMELVQSAQPLIMYKYRSVEVRVSSYLQMHLDDRVEKFKHPEERKIEKI